MKKLICVFASIKYANSPSSMLALHINWCTFSFAGFYRLKNQSAMITVLILKGVLLLFIVLQQGKAQVIEELSPGKRPLRENHLIEW